MTAERSEFRAKIVVGAHAAVRTGHTDSPVAILEAQHEVAVVVRKKPVKRRRIVGEVAVTEVSGGNKRNKSYTSTS